MRKYNRAQMASMVRKAAKTAWESMEFPLEPDPLDSSWMDLGHLLSVCDKLWIKYVPKHAPAANETV